MFVYLFYITGIFELRVTASFIGIFFLSYYAFHLNRDDVFSFIIPSLFITGIAINFIFNDGALHPFLIFELVSSIGLVLFMLKTRLNYRLAALVFYGLSLFFIVHMFNGSSPSDVLVAGSRNYISVLLLFTIILYLIAIRQKSLSLSIFPVFVFMVISVWAVGRSGILVSFLLFFSIFILNIKRYIKLLSLDGSLYQVLQQYAILIIFFSGVVYFTVSNYQLDFTSIFSRFYEQKLVEDGRLSILFDYIANLEVKSFIFGFPESFTYFQGMIAHISYLNGHEVSGVFSILVFGIVMYAVAKGFLLRDIYLLLLIAVLLRGLFDTVMFVSGAFNFVFLYLVIFLVLKSHNYRSLENGNTR